MATAPAVLYLLALTIVLQFLFPIQRIPFFPNSRFDGPVFQRQVTTRPFTQSTYLVMDWLFKYDRNIIFLSTALLLMGNVTLFIDPVMEEFGWLRYALDRLQVKRIA